MSAFEVFNVEDNEVMFEPPVSRGATLKYPWYYMEPGMFFYVPLDDAKPNYRPGVPCKLANDGYKVEYRKQELKETGQMCMVITRIE